MHPVLEVLGFGHQGEGELSSALVGRESYEPSPVIRYRTPQNSRPKRSNKLGVGRIDHEVLNALCNRHGARSPKGV